MLSMLEMALDDNSFMGDWYFDRETDDVTFITTDDYLEEEEEIKRLVEEDEGGERFIYISPIPSSGSWQIMKEFILEQDDLDDTVQSLLLRAIQGSGAFRRFNDAIDDVGIRDRWYAYKNMEDRKRALQWLKDHELISDDGVAAGIKMLEDNIARRNRIEDDRGKIVWLPKSHFELV